MPSEMNHRERVFAALAGEEVDRPPVSMWRHYFDSEGTPENLAGAMLAHQDRYGWDFMKINPRGTYRTEVWGTEWEYDGGNAYVMTSVPVEEPDDWERIEAVGLDHPVLAEHLRAIELISEGLAGRVPFLMTVFTPVGVAARLVPSTETLVAHLKEHPAKVNAALEAITETFVAFAGAALERGASGLFYATHDTATTDVLTAEEYRRLVRPWDLRVLEGLPPTEFTMLHVCRDRCLLAEMAGYPVQAVNWDAAGEGNASLAEGKALVGDRTVVGGVPVGASLVQTPASELEAGIRDVSSVMGARGWMLAPGCTYDPKTPEVNVQSVRRAAGLA